MSSYSLLEEKIKSAESILIVTHVNPDGDALGSEIAVKNLLKNKFNKNSDAVLIGRFPDVYNYLPSKDELIDLSDFDTEKIYDLAIGVDLASLDRLCGVEKTYNNAKFNVNIDHHKTNNKYGDITFVDGNASSTGEVLYQIFENISYDIDKDTAIALYTSIVTDTGCFKYKNTTEKSMVICSKLLSKGADPSEITQQIYGNKPKAMVLLNAYAVSNTKFSNNGKIAYTIVTLNDLNKFNAETDYTEGIVEVLREINTVEVAIFFKEMKNGYTKVSMRSKNIDIASVCKKYDGGGHTNAAGCTVMKPVNIAVEKILDEFKDII